METAVGIFIILYFLCNIMLFIDTVANPLFRAEFRKLWERVLFRLILLFFGVFVIIFILLLEMRRTD